MSTEKAVSKRVYSQSISDVSMGTSGGRAPREPRFGWVFRRQR